jgi:hypothetical protein
LKQALVVPQWRVLANIIVAGLHFLNILEDYAFY